MINNNQILMVFPRLGSEDVFIKDMPIGLLYAATDALKNGHSVKILDLRLHKNHEQALRENLTDNVKIVGISVYTGYPIKTSLAISKLVKETTTAKVVWGGPHASIEPNDTIKDPNIDFLIRGYGSKAFGLLADHILSAKGSLSDIEGLSYKCGGKILHNRVSDELELIDYRDIPYGLIEDNIRQYSRFNSGEVLIPIYTSVGCPYRCAFCVSPVVYKEKKVKWNAYSDENILSHIKFLKEKFKVDHISIYDDDAFVDLKRVKRLLKLIKEQGFNVRISFRGARINELDKIDEETLSLLEDVGATHFQVGVESGSDRILQTMDKGINVEQILRVNRKLSKFRKLVPIYNLMSGIPGETLDDLKDTARIMIALYNENPNCIIGHPVKFKPYPGSELFTMAVQMGLKRPGRLEDWIQYDSGEADIYFDWYTPKYNHFIKMMQVTSYFVDNKITREIKATTPFNVFLRVISRIYQPIAYFRLKHKFDKFLIEDYLLKMFRSLMRAV